MSIIVVRYPYHSDRIPSQRLHTKLFNSETTTVSLLLSVEKNRSIWNSPEFSIIICAVMSVQNRIVDKKSYREL
jgi:hypothetical protein